MDGVLRDTEDLSPYRKDLGTERHATFTVRVLEDIPCDQPP